MPKNMVKNKYRLPVLCLFFVISIALFVLAACGKAAAGEDATKGLVIYVAPDGRGSSAANGIVTGTDTGADTNSPAVTSARSATVTTTSATYTNATGTADAPFATMTQARNHVRRLRAQGETPAGGVTVYFRGGTYPVTETVHFTAEDSGTPESPIVYAAYPGETPVFSGGLYFSGNDFNPVTDIEMLKRLKIADAGKTDAQKNVVCINLFDYGLTSDDLDYAQEFWKNGDLREDFREERQDANYIPHNMQVFWDDEALHLARYPNKIEGTFAENPYSTYLGMREITEAGKPETSSEGASYALPSFKTYEERIKKWKNYEDVIIFGMMAYEFGSERRIAGSINPDTMTVELKTQAWAELLQYNRYGFENVFEELDAPGEYYIDKETGVLYIYSENDMSNASDASGTSSKPNVSSESTPTIKISVFDENYMIDLDGASDITFEGLTFELTKGSVARVVSGENCIFSGCTFKNFGGMGVKLGTWVISSRDYWEFYSEKDGFNKDIIYEHPPEEHGFNHVIKGCIFLNTGYAAADIASGHVLERKSGGMRFENNLVWHSGLLGGTYNSGLVLNGVGITVKNNSFFFCEGQAINGNVVDTEIIYNEFCDSPCNMSEDTGAIYLNYVCINDGVKIRYNYFHDVSNRDARGIGFDYRRRGSGYYDNSMPFQDFSFNVLYRMPGGSTFTIVGPSTRINNIFIDCDDPLTYPEEWLRYTAEDALTPAELLKNNDRTQWSLYRTGLYKNEQWRKNYPELYEYYLYMLNEKKDLLDICDTVTNNLYVSISETLSGRLTMIPDNPHLDPRYGKIENNHYTDIDPGFADYRNFDFQLSKNAAKALGIQAINMSKIGAPNAPKPTRITLPCDDPLENVRESVNLCFCFINGEMFVPVDLWRELAPGVWQWVDSNVTDSEFAVGFPAKPGGTYVAFYQGDRLNEPQFTGGVTAPEPTAAVATVTVPKSAQPEDFLWHEFKLLKR